MTPSLYYFRKTRFTFLSVFFSYAIFAHTIKADFFIIKEAPIKTLEGLFVGPPKSTANTGFYPKEKTVFHSCKSMWNKRLYCIPSKEVKENKKGTTCSSSVKTRLKENNHTLNIPLKSFSKLPFRRGSSIFHDNFFARVIVYRLQNAKKAPSFNKTTGKKNQFLNDFSSIQGCRLLAKA